MNYVAALAVCFANNCNLMPQPFYSLDECRHMRDTYRERALTSGPEYFCVVRNENGALVRKE